MHGEVETEKKVLVIRRIHVVFRIIAPPDAAETIERVHKMYANHCPIYRSIEKAIAITSEYHRQWPPS